MAVKKRIDPLVAKWHSLVTDLHEQRLAGIGEINDLSCMHIVGYSLQAMKASEDKSDLIRQASALLYVQQADLYLLEAPSGLSRKLLFEPSEISRLLIHLCFLTVN
jgi:hypothetical protein